MDNAGSDAAAILVLASLGAMLVGWYFACRWVAEQPGKVHYIAFAMMLLFWPAGIPGAYVGTQRRKERLAEEGVRQETEPAPSRQHPQPVLPPPPPP